MTDKSQLLRQPEVKPEENLLSSVLDAEIYDVYRSLVGMAVNELHLKQEWRYYNDGKAWLCKYTYGSKTVFWLSVWEKFIKTSFYFTAKSKDGIFDLAIHHDVKEQFEGSAQVGKLIPLILDIDNIKKLNDWKEIASYKKSLK